MYTLAKNAQNANGLRVSDKYQFISTEQVHAVLNDFGFQESRYREGRNVTGYQRHLSIFNRAQDVDEQGGFNLLLLNSHDGTSSLRLEAGYFRMLCENQLGHGDVGVRVSHRGNALEKLELAIPQVLLQMEDFKRIKDLLRGKVLSREQMLDFALKALATRVDLSTLDEYQTSMNLHSILHSRRYADGGDGAWEVYNRVQENVIKGGIRLITNTGTLECPKDTRRKIRGITGIDKLVETNKTLTQAIIQVAA